MIILCTITNVAFGYRKKIWGNNDKGENIL